VREALRERLTQIDTHGNAGAKHVTHQRHDTIGLLLIRVVDYALLAS
jgi:hypothetical protein